MKRIMITGSSGLIGSHALKYFLEHTDWEIVCPVTFKYRGVLDRLRLVLSKDEYLKRTKIVMIDLSSPITSLAAKEFGKIDYVLNFASQSHIPDSIENPSNFIINNVSIVTNILDWAKTHDQLAKFIQVGTDAVYGPLINEPHKEWESLILPGTPYAASKSAQDDICFAYWKTYNVPIILTNTMNVFGEMQGSEKFIPIIIKNLLNNSAIKIHCGSNGEIGSRHYIHAYSHVDALFYMINNVNNFNDAKPEKFNIVGDSQVNNLEMVNKIAQIVNIKPNIEMVNFESSRPGHDLKYGLDGSKLNNLGWKNPKPFNNAIEETVNWYLNNKDWLSV